MTNPGPDPIRRGACGRHGGALSTRARGGPDRSGYTLVEVLMVALVISLVASAALPSFRTLVDQIRARTALDRVVSELYRARMYAVSTGNPVRLELRSSGGCVHGIRLVLQAATPEGERSHLLRIEPLGVCLRHTGDSVVVFNSRGMLLPPTRSFHVSYGAAADSVLISIAGRVRRSYRRRSPPRREVSEV